jgi:hypothetical protein
MAYLTTLAGHRDGGYDAARNSVVVPLNGTTSLYLVAGSGVDIRIDNPDVASCSHADPAPWERKQAKVLPWDANAPLKRLDIKGRRVGQRATVSFRVGTAEVIEPLRILVVDNMDARQITGTGTVPPALREEIASMSLRDAVLRVAVDQMNSTIGRTANAGFGRYGVGQQYDWCGAFAWWCWEQACKIQNTSNPFGKNPDNLLSPQKAITYGMKYSGRLQVVRYAGGALYAGWSKDDAKLSIAREVTLSERSIERADICLYRNEGNWRHVCIMDTSLSGDFDDFTTMDGNQGMPCIKRNTRYAGKKVQFVGTGRQEWSYAFIRVRDA